MRLYAKLFLMIALACWVQRHAPPSEWGGDVWFGLRCHAAQLTGDHELQMRLVDEHYRRNHTVDDDAHVHIDLEMAYLMASAG
jgi:hypothetical protein